MQREAHSLREDLYRVIENYAELAKIARKGGVDPLSYIGRIVKKTAPYLLLVVQDLLPQLERGEITYHEALYTIIKAAQRFPNHQILEESRKEVQEIEHEGRIFLYGVKWLDMPTHQRPGPHEIDTIEKKLRDLNEKYKNRYGSQELRTSTLIPCFLRREETDSTETTLSRMADLVRRAVLELYHLMVENEPERTLLFFSRNSRKEIEDDLMHLVWFLFRCGYSVDRIAMGYHKVELGAFLNEKILDHLIATENTTDTLQGVSSHLWLLTMIDFASFFDLANDYVPIDDHREALHQAKVLKARKRRGANLLRKAADLRKLYTGRPHGHTLVNFLSFRYDSSFGAYHGDNRVFDQRGPKAVALYKPRLDQEAMAKRAELDLKEAGRGYSTKTREEMAGLIKLIVDSLRDPAKVKGKKLKILGDISSGAMGKVSIGIYDNQIVAIKRVK
ncbi:MAG: hypothetical protein FJY85_11120, partial [Deltaproteobacteria bacterium]|nr:hypothetical protein [Deltaproteobacteria bacterium]